MFYLHFWEKNGTLTRQPHETAEEAEAAGWAWEKAERVRMNPDDKIGGFPGRDRDIMHTVITDEDNVIQDIPFFGMGFIHDLRHNPYVSNDNYWATRLEAASRGITPDTIPPCRPGCYNCEHNIDINGKFAVTGSIDRDVEILRLFVKGSKRQEIATKLGVSYQTVCRVIRERARSASA